MPYKDTEAQRVYDHTHWERNKEKHREANRKSYQKYRDTDAFKERNKTSSKKRRDQIRSEVLEAYGAKCAYCGYNSDPRALDLDHVNNDGNVERKSLRAFSLNEYVRRNNFPDTYQLLCRNCNWIKYLDSKGIKTT
jgi:predicted restriction endonuclease